MNDKEKIFDNYIKREGGIYLPTGDNDFELLYSTILDSSQKFIEDIRKLNPDSPPVNIYFINSEELNACAFTSDSEYFIGINKGVVVKLKMIFDTIFSSDKIFNNTKFTKSLADSYSPMFLYYTTIFLTIHEYSHIRFRHCDLINQLWGDRISELTSNATINDGMFRQTLEYDADCCTITDISYSVLRISKGDTSKISKEIGQWMLSCYILFKIFNNNEYTHYENYNLDSLENSTHPRPGLRQHYLLANIATILMKHFEETLVSEIIQEIMDYIELFEGTLNDQYDLKKMEMGIAYTQKGSEHLTRIANNWKDIRAMLEPYTHVKLAHFEKVDFVNNIND